MTQAHHTQDIEDKMTSISKTLKNRMLFTSLLSSLCLLPAYANCADTEKWEFQLAPYGWLAGQNGQVGTVPGLPPADVDVDFYDDVFGNINGAVMLVGEARKGDFGLFADILYMDIEMEESTPGPLFTSLTSQTKSWIISAAGFYRAYEEQGRFLDLFGGIRYWSVDSKLSSKAGLLPAGEISNKEDWVDPVIGLKGKTPLGGSPFFMTGAFTFGGFGVGSDLMWDASVNLGYQWTEGFSTTIGYRYLDVDYDNDGYVYDISQDGPTIGLLWRF